ncbi:MAG TPA: hypothetical protein VGR97_06435 [Candidatus Acidoferrales bacterium]|nr:hypothetical protein [Candidatus Acidoferrales bacterium]
MASVQPPFDLYRSSTQPRTNFFPHDSPVISVPADGVVLRHPTCCAHTQNFLQAMLLPHPPMGIARVTGCHREALFGKKVHFQKMVGSDDAVDPRQPHLLHQTVLKTFKEPLNAPFRLRTVRRNLRTALSIGPVPVDSTRLAPSPWALRPPMKPDILTLQRQVFRGLLSKRGGVAYDTARPAI